MNYLILSTPTLDYGLELSSALWRLSSPSSVQSSEGRQTKYWSQPIQHPNGKVALPFPEDGGFIHPEADLDNLAPFIGGVSEEEQEAISRVILLSAGQRISFAEVFGAAPSLQSQIKTQTEMEAEGWFPSNLS